MKKTIQGFIVYMIDRYLAKCQFAVAVCDVKIAGVFSYTLLWLSSPFIVGMCLLASHYHVLALICVSTLFINWRIISDEKFFANKQFDALCKERTKLNAIIARECRFKYLLKKSIKKKLDSIEYYELSDLLKKMSVDIKEIPNIRTDVILCPDEKVTNEV